MGTTLKYALVEAIRNIVWNWFCDSDGEDFACKCNGVDASGDIVRGDCDRCGIVDRLALVEGEVEGEGEYLCHDCAPEPVRGLLSRERCRNSADQFASVSDKDVRRERGSSYIFLHHT